VADACDYYATKEAIPCPLLHTPTQPTYPQHGLNKEQRQKKTPEQVNGALQSDHVPLVI
jgi:hypothetical protein